MQKILRRQSTLKQLPLIALALILLFTLHGSLAQEVMPEEIMCSGELPIVGTGPNGETATPLSDLEITEADAEIIRAGNFTAAIAMHMLSSDWPQLQVAGITETLAQYGIEVIAVTDGELRAEKQIADIESLIELDPDVIFTIPVDNDALGNVTQSISDAGIQVVLIDSMPTGLVPGEDYLGLGASDNYSIGASAAELIAESLDGVGKVAVLRWGFHVFQTEQRRMGALDTFAQYPGIEIVFDEDVNSVEDATAACENVLTRTPDIAGFWTAWDGLGTACAQAVNGMSRTDVVVTSVDLSSDSGLWIARGSQFIGTAAQHPYDQGVAEAMIALYHFAGRVPPVYVVVPGRTVTRSNVVCAMNLVFHEAPDQAFIDLAGPQEELDPAAMGAMSVEEMATALAERGEEVIIGLITKTESNPFFISMREGAQSAADALGITLLNASGESNTDNASQVTAIENMVAAGVTGILLVPADSSTIVPTIEWAREQGVVVIALDTPTEPIDATNGLFATDNFQAGVLIGQYARAAMENPDEAIIALMSFPPGITVGDLRQGGFLEGFGIDLESDQVVCVQDSQGDQTTSQTAMENCLVANPEINLVYSINEPAAFGAYTAVENAGVADDVMIVSVDGGCAGVAGIADGRIAATSQQYPLRMASMGVEALAYYTLTGISPEGYTDTGVTLITANPVEGIESEDTDYGLANCWG